MKLWEKVADASKKIGNSILDIGSEGQRRYEEYSQQEDVNRAAKAAQLQSIMGAGPVEPPTQVKFQVLSNYHGGYPGLPDIMDGGNLYLGDTELVWLRSDLAIRLPYTDIYDLELDNFKVSMARSIIAGGHDNDVHQLKNTLVVVCRIQGVKQRVRFEIWGGLSVHSGALNAQKIIDHLAVVRHLFIQLPDPTAAPAAQVGSVSVTAELERLAALFERGILDEQEFKDAKAKLISKL